MVSEPFCGLEILILEESEAEPELNWRLFEVPVEAVVVVIAPFSLAEVDIVLRVLLCGLKVVEPEGSKAELKLELRVPADLV